VLHAKVIRLIDLKAVTSFSILRFCPQQMLRKKEKHGMAIEFVLSLIFG